MASFLEAIAVFSAFIVYSTLKASVLIVLVILVQKTLGRLLTANGHYLLWLPVVISLLTPIGFKAVIPQAFIAPVQIELPPTGPAASTNQSGSAPMPLAPNAYRNKISRTGFLPALVNSMPAQQANESTPFGWYNLLLLTWCAGVVLLLGVVLIRNFRFSRLVHQAHPAHPDLQKLLDSCRQEALCQTPIRLITTPAIAAPLISGCFKPALLLPEGIQHQLSKAQLRHVFLHELMHVKRFDIAGNWLLALLQILHWFNPLIWFGFNRIRNDRELVCDAATLHHLGCRHGQAYGHTLLQLSQPQSRRFVVTNGIGIVDSTSELRKRIVMIVQMSFPARKHSLLTGLLLLVFGGLAFSKPVVENASGKSVEATVAIAQSTANLPVIAEAAKHVTSTAPTPAMPALEPKQVSTPASSFSASPLSAPAAGIDKNKPAVTRSTATTAAAIDGGATTASAQTADKSATHALIAMESTNSLHAAAPAVEKNSAPLPTTWSGLAAMDTLTRSINAAKSDGLRFVAQWNATASACADAPGQHRRRIPCQMVKNISNSNQLYDFKLQCAALADEYNKLARDYSAASTASLANQEAIAATMLRNYQDLTAFCSAATYNKNYPAFAKLFNVVTAKLDSARIAKARSGFADGIFAYTNEANTGSNGYGPVEPSGPNPANYGIAAPGAASTGGQSAGAGNSDAASAGVGQTR